MLRPSWKQAGTAMMGIGTSSGDTRAVDAAQQAISSPLLESSIDGATRVLLSIAGSKDTGIREISDAADVVANAVDPEANIIFGTVVDESRAIRFSITVIATGFSDSNVNRQDELFAAQQSQSKAAASAEPQRTAPAASPAQAAPTRNVGGTELPTSATISSSFRLPEARQLLIGCSQRFVRGCVHLDASLFCFAFVNKSLQSLYVPFTFALGAAGILLRKYDSRVHADCSGDAAVLVLLGRL